MRRGICLVLVAPSGGGKTTILQALIKNDPNLRQSISATTRDPRAGEIDGVHYHFMSQAGFEEKIASGDMLEHAKVLDRYYGIPKGPVLSQLDAGIDLGFAIDWQGNLNLRRQMPDDVCSVFLVPPSLDEIERRLRARGDKPESIQRRMQEAEIDMQHVGDCDFAVSNTNLQNAIEEVRTILENARQMRSSFSRQAIPSLG